MRKTLLKATVLSALLFGVFSRAHAYTIIPYSDSHTRAIAGTDYAIPSGNFCSFALYRSDELGTIGTQINTSGFTCTDNEIDVSNPSYYGGETIPAWFLVRIFDGNAPQPEIARGWYYYDTNYIGTGNDTTRFIGPYWPSNGGLATSTSVYFSAKYFFNDATHYGLLDTVAFDIADMTAGTPAVRFGSTLIDASGIDTFSSTKTLISGHLYLWRPVMFSSMGSSTPVVGDFYSLDVVTRSASSTPYVGATLGDTTLASSTNLLSFLNVPYLLATKVPFGYFFQAKDAIEAGINGSTTASIPNGTFSIKIGHSTTTVDMFSTSTIGYFLTPSMVSLIRGLMVAILYFEFIYLLYRVGKAQHLI